MQATDGPPPSSPLLNTTVPAQSSPAAASQKTAEAASVAAALGPERTLPAAVMLLEGASEPVRLALVNAAAPAGAPADAPGGAQAGTEAAGLAPAVLHGQLANDSSQPEDSIIITSLKRSSVAPVDAPVTQAVVTNASGEPPVLTQYGDMYDLRNAASAGTCKTLWQLMQLSPNLTCWAQAVEVNNLTERVTDMC